MLQGNYLRRLREDLPKWREKGWVTEEGSAAILTEVGESHSAMGFSVIVGVLGALLLGIGVIAFIASAWEEIPRILRFFMLIAGMAAAYAAAWRLARADLHAFSEAALLTAGLIFAAAIALIGQSYHLSGDFYSALLYWEIGALLAAVLTRSNMTVVLALVGACYWNYEFTANYELVPHWESLVLILIGGAIGVWAGGPASRVCTVLALFFWLGLTIIGLGKPADWDFSGAMALLLCTALALWSVGTALSSWTEEPRLNALGSTFMWPAMLSILFLAGLLQFTAVWGNSGKTGSWLALSAIALALALLLGAAALLRKGATIVDLGVIAILGVGAVLFALEDVRGSFFNPSDRLDIKLAGAAILIVAALWAIQIGQSGVLWIAKPLGLMAFGIELIYLYAVTLGTILDTAFAFLLGGVLFIAISFLLFRLDRHLSAKRKAATA